MLISMPDTTVRVSPRNRDRLRAIADAEGLSMDEALSLLLRRHRQREMGQDLSNYDPDAADEAVLATGADTVARR
jgi:predicted transcriptional regulator